MKSPNPTEWEQETTKALNALAVECAFGVIDREDLPRLATEALGAIRKATSEAIGQSETEPEKPDERMAQWRSIRNELRDEQRQAIGIREEAA